jgi:hypothetical protein
MATKKFFRVEVVFTNRKIDDPVILAQQKHYSFLIDGTKDPAMGIKIGDIVESPVYATPMQVCGFYEITSEYYGNIKLKYLSYDSIIRNGKHILKNNKPMKSNKMMSNFMDKFKSQFLPVVDESLTISMNGQVCVPMNGEYVAIDANGELVSYPKEFTMDMPVYLISKDVEAAQVGDVVRTGNSSYSKVVEIERGADGKVSTIKSISYSGTNRTVKPIKDFMLGQKTLKVVVNLFNGFQGGQINPMFMMLADKDNSEGQDMLMMLIAMQSMNPSNKGIMNEINPMMLMMFMDGNESGGDMFKTMMMMQFMQGGMGNMFGNGMNMFGNMFGQNNENAKQTLND